MVAAKVTTRWTTIATVGYTVGVNPTNENRAAHGGVCHLQARRKNGKLVGRRVLANGHHVETEEAFELDTWTLDHWRTIAESQK
jgi:hypothetical protein